MWKEVKGYENLYEVNDEIQNRTEYLCPKAFQMPADEDVEVWQKN